MRNPIKHLLAAMLLMSSAFVVSAQAADYVIDTKGAHASINFKIKHLGYSWLIGRFNHFSGSFSYDEKNPSTTKVKVEIDTAQRLLKLGNVFGYT